MNGFYDAGAFSDFLASILEIRVNNLQRKSLASCLVEDADCHVALYTR